jgi:hypothetical protein
VAKPNQDRFIISMTLKIEVNVIRKYFELQIYPSKLSAVPLPPFPIA